MNFRWLLVLLSLVVVGCDYYTLPSRSLAIDVRSTQASIDNVQLAVVAELLGFGFVREAPDGYEEITKQRHGVSLTDKKGLYIDMSTLDSATVKLKMSEDIKSKHLSAAAELQFEKLVSALEGRFPGSITRL